MRVFLLVFAALIVAAGTGFYAWYGMRPKPAPVEAAVVEAPPSRPRSLPRLPS